MQQKKQKKLVAAPPHWWQEQKSQQGFSLFELVTIIVIMGILCGAYIATTQTPQRLKATLAINQIASELRRIRMQSVGNPGAEMEYITMPIGGRGGSREGYIHRGGSYFLHTVAYSDGSSGPQTFRTHKIAEHSSYYSWGIDGLAHPADIRIQVTGTGYVGIASELLDCSDTWGGYSSFCGVGFDANGETLLIGVQSSISTLNFAHQPYALLLEALPGEFFITATTANWESRSLRLTQSGEILMDTDAGFF